MQLSYTDARDCLGLACCTAVVLLPYQPPVDWLCTAVEYDQV